ncbi:MULTISPECIES: hypothetical protein [Burkholderia]|uniref:hypothetical protein n=1 Tax=Burkholderia TaxID=32008 RepID=UPI000758336F|nr:MULTISPECIES: hypothetical protein [Burkholderia]AOJ71031.1 hypothetical protein WS78_19245 [Burkholderia savannae]KVG48905.1 hypothetical protein WS77_04100 [Burkholderia sp. MSMB0265]KVG86366.1 hypothetical protein WS81_30770 [Burkholderia sp. MSMB2040]KVG90643.1 hypothetical protein WS82_18235 [Burkholderia sp. MSMB2041]KVH00297.1 hypothetical protein WS83_24000 [Burkholderia sp. MSMB2042]
MSRPISFARGGLGALVVASAASALVAGATGYVNGQRAGARAADAKLAAVERRHADALRDAAESARAQEREGTLRANRLAADLFTANAHHALEADALKRRIARVTRQYRPTPDARPEALPRCVFTDGFVGVWNAAAGRDAARLPEADPAAGAAAPAGSADDADSGVRADDVLANHVDNARRSRNIEAQLNTLIDWLEGSGQ